MDNLSCGHPNKSINEIVSCFGKDYLKCTFCGKVDNRPLFLSLNDCNLDKQDLTDDEAQLDTSATGDIALPCCDYKITILDQILESKNPVFTCPGCNRRCDRKSLLQEIDKNKEIVDISCHRKKERTVDNSSVDIENSLSKMSLDKGTSPLSTYKHDYAGKIDYSSALKDKNCVIPKTNMTSKEMLTIFPCEHYCKTSELSKYAIRHGLYCCNICEIKFSLDDNQQFLKDKSNGGIQYGKPIHTTGKSDFETLDPKLHKSDDTQETKLQSHDEKYYFPCGHYILKDNLSTWKISATKYMCHYCYKYFAVDDIEQPSSISEEIIKVSKSQTRNSASISSNGEKNRHTQANDVFYEKKETGDNKCHRNYRSELNSQDSKHKMHGIEPKNEQETIQLNGKQNITVDNVKSQYSIEGTKQNSLSLKNGAQLNGERVYFPCKHSTYTGFLNNFKIRDSTYGCKSCDEEFDFSDIEQYSPTDKMVKKLTSKNGQESNEISDMTTNQNNTNKYTLNYRQTKPDQTEETELYAGQNVTNESRSKGMQSINRNQSPPYEEETDQSSDRKQKTKRDKYEHQRSPKDTKSQYNVSKIFEKGIVDVTNEIRSKGTQSIDRNQLPLYDEEMIGSSDRKQKTHVERNGSFRYDREMDYSLKQRKDETYSDDHINQRSITHTTTKYNQSKFLHRDIKKDCVDVENSNKTGFELRSSPGYLNYRSRGNTSECYTCKKKNSKSLSIETKHRKQCLGSDDDDYEDALSSTEEINDLIYKESSKMKLQSNVSLFFEKFGSKIEKKKDQLDRYLDMATSNEHMFLITKFSKLAATNFDIGKIKRMNDEMIENLEFHDNVNNALDHLMNASSYDELNSIEREIKSLKIYFEDHQHITTPPPWMLHNALKWNLGLFLNSLTDKSANVAVFQDGNFSVISIQGDHIYVPCLRPKQKLRIAEGSLYLPYKLVENLIAKPNHLVYFEIDYGMGSNSNIIIKVTEQNNYSRIFTNLCAGTEQGLSYRGTRFHRNSYLGLDGHHIWGGDIKKGDGSGTIGFQTKDDNISESPISKGLVAGRNGYRDISSIFRIFINGCSEGFEQCKIGEVVKGMTVLEHVSTNCDLTDLIIKDCGVIISLN